MEDEWEMQLLGLGLGFGRLVTLFRVLTGECVEIDK